MALTTAPHVARLEGERWQDVIRLANRLLAAGVPVYRLHPDPAGEVPWPAGTFFCAADRPTELPPALSAGLSVRLVAEPPERLAGVPLVRLSRPRVGLYGGGGSPYNHAGVFAALGFETDFIHDAEIRAGRLADFDVLVFPGGGLQAMLGQLNPLGREGAEAIARFVRGGGMYIGCCAGAFNAALVGEAFLQLCPAQAPMRLINARVWNDGDQWVGLASPGVGVVEVHNSEPDHPVMWGLPERFAITHYNGPMFALTEQRELAEASLARALARFVGRTDRFTPAERFLAGPAESPCLFDRGVAAGTACAVSGEIGLGRVVLFGSHPEFGASLLLDDWSVAALMLANAVLWQSTQRPAWRVPWERPAVAAAGSAVPRARPPAAALDRLRHRFAALLPAVEVLQQLPVSELRWLQPDYSLSVFGLSPGALWAQGLSALQDAIRQCLGLCGQVGELAEAAAARPGSRAEAALAALDSALWYRRDAAWEQDVGYQGLFALVQRSRELLERALANAHAPLPDPVGHPYQHIDVNPYHLAVGSYLSALGLVAGARQLLLRAQAELSDAAALGSWPAP